MVAGDRRDLKRGDTGALAGRRRAMPARGFVRNRRRCGRVLLRQGSRGRQAGRAGSSCCVEDQSPERREREFGWRALFFIGTSAGFGVGRISVRWKWHTICCFAKMSIPAASQVDIFEYKCNGFRNSCRTADCAAPHAPQFPESEKPEIRGQFVGCDRDMAAKITPH